MKKMKGLLKQPWFAYTFAACSAVLFYMLLSNFSVFSDAVKGLWRLISPIVIGLIVAYLMSPVASFFENKVFGKLKKESTRQLLGVVFSAVCFILIIVLLLVALIPSLVQSISKLVSNWPMYTVKLEELLNQAAGLAEKFGIALDLSNISGLIDSVMEKGIAFLKTNANSILSTVGSVGTSVSNFFIGLLFGFLFLVTKKVLLRFTDAVRRAIHTEEQIEKSNALLLRCHKIFIRYVGVTLIDALIVGVATLLFLLITGMPYAPLIAIVVAITNIIPTFGPMIGGAIGIFFLILDKPLNALFFFIFICFIQAIDGAVIKPRLFSGSLGIPGVWTLILIILGGKLAGMLGILLAIPFAAIFVIVYNETIVPKLEKRKEKINRKKE